MSEVKFNLIDAQEVLSGAIHGSVVDSCVAALSAEPETSAELEVALGRYIKREEGSSIFALMRRSREVDSEPWDAGLVIIDLAARIVATESTYSNPQPGTQATDIAVPYQLPEDWLFVNSIDAYRWSSERRRSERRARLPFDARAVLYGRPLLEFIAASAARLREMARQSNGGDESDAALASEISKIHAAWLMTPRKDLRDRSPREILLEKREFIDRDLESRSLQWSIQGEGPPCLPHDSFAYRFAGFGTHEWVVYYDLVRHLFAKAGRLNVSDSDALVRRLEQAKRDWLENGDGEYEGKTPANIIENERRRLPQAMTPQELIIDENCDICRMSALEAEMGYGPGFWHLDGSHMDDDFAFSSCLTREEWEAENRHREEMMLEISREQEERRRITRAEIDDEFYLGWNT
jgi:hypothetical protein